MPKQVFGALNTAPENDLGREIALSAPCGSTDFCGSGDYIESRGLRDILVKERRNTTWSQRTPRCSSCRREHFAPAVATTSASAPVPEIATGNPTTRSSQSRFVGISPENPCNGSLNATSGGNHQSEADGHFFREIAHFAGETICPRSRQRSQRGGRIRKLS